MNWTRRLTSFFQKPEVKQEDIYTERGSSGTPAYHGYITRDFNSSFHGQKAIKIYEEMRSSDATIAAVLSALKLPILQASWMVESVDSEDEKQKEIAEFVRKNLESVSGGFKQFLREALAHLDFGFYYFEKVYEIKDGMVQLKKLAPRIPSAHRLWIMESDPKTPGITQFLPNIPETEENKAINREIPMSKLVLFINEKEGDNFEGKSILRTAYKHWYIKDALYRIDSIKLERGAGILKITLPEGATPTDRTKATELGENFKVNDQAYLVIPNEQWKVELMTAGFSDQSSALMESVQHHNREIVLNVLAQFLDLGGSETGSHALSKDQTDFFGLSLRSIAEYIASILSEQLIKELVKLNYGEQEEYPRFVFSRIGEIDFTEMSTVLKTLKESDLIKVDPQLKVWIHKQFALPEVTVDSFEDEEQEIKIDDESKKKEQKQEKQELAEFAMGSKRPLTLAEERVKLAELETIFDEKEQELNDFLLSISDEQKQELMKKAEKAFDTQDLSIVTALSLMGISKLSSGIKDFSKSALEEGKRTSANELGVAVPTTAGFTKKVLDAKVDLLVDNQKIRLENMFKARMVDLMNNEVGKTAGLAEIEKLIDETIQKTNREMVGRVIVDFFNEGRALTFEANKLSIHGLQRSEILDKKTCPMCQTLDGRVLSVNDPFTKIGPVHSYCRGFWVSILKTDAQLPQIKVLPKTIKSKFETIEGVPTINEFKQLKKPIVTKGSRLEKKIERGQV